MTSKLEKLKVAFDDTKYILTFPSILMVGFSAGILVGKKYPAISIVTVSILGLIFGAIFLLLLGSCIRDGEVE